ncbi:hypothetical protein CGZ91_06840 [Parenemella sanctibonifatiensis]|uniref:Amidohydrolase-related domain-containing protein n=2 Tax=Parenemella sanctibonifatiensis TaxID=2016505 RepID=A0A255EI27_9ACTN|nr:hypothetical protein CGZ91_06840 [Parenemella sanctibonifatiensis]
MSDAPLERFAELGGIDVTAFVGTSPWRLAATIDVAGLGRQADRLGLAGVCVSHLASVFGFDTRTGNEALAEAIAGDARLWFTPVLNPSEPGWEAELEWALEEGATGIRLTPGCHGYDADHPALAELATAAQEAELALHLLTTMDDPRERHPRYAFTDWSAAEVANFLRLAGAAPVVISGLRTYDWPEVHSCLDHGHDLSGILVDTWRMNGPVAALRMMTEQWGDLLAYGTCQPGQDAVASAYQLATARISAAERLAAAAGNAGRVLGRVAAPRSSG